MRATIEADLVRRDARLPGLGTLLDARVFGDRLKQEAPQANVASARLGYLRYKPGRNCLAAYSVEVGGVDVDVYAKAYCHEDSGKLDKATSRVESLGPLGRGRLLFPDQLIEVAVFPNDNELKALSHLADPQWRAGFLARKLPELAALGPVALRTMTYKPERRWVGALEAEGIPYAVGKLHGEPEFAQICARSASFQPGERLRLAEPLARSRRHRAVFTRWQSGLPLSQALAGVALPSAEVESVGFALAELHSQFLPDLPIHDLTREGRQLLELAEQLAFILPEEGQRFRQSAERLAQFLEAELPSAVSLHGDFSAQQILLNQDGAVVVLDLDEAHRGNPLTDLGSFIASLEVDFLRSRLTEGRRDGLIEAFLRGYMGLRIPVRRAALERHVAVRLFLRLPEFFRAGDPDWPERTQRTLRRIEALLAKTCPSPLGQPALAKPMDPALPSLPTALNSNEVGPMLAGVVRAADAEVTAATLRSVRLMRHKPGRRALIEYQLSCRRRDGQIQSRSFLGKIRRRGLDIVNLSQLTRLQREGFSNDSADGISIPSFGGSLPALGLWLQEKVSAESFAQLVVGPSGPRAARRAAEAISKLHRHELGPLRAHSVADELQQLEHCLQKLAARNPELTRRLTALHDRCRRLADQLPTTPCRLIHRDFYHDQVLLAGDRIWLVDLDLLCVGDPALDVGNFVGHLLELAVRTPARRSPLEHAAAIFADRCLELNPLVTPFSIATYATLTLARHVFLSTQFVDRAPFATSILELCEQRCELSLRS